VDRFPKAGVNKTIRNQIQAFPKLTSEKSSFEDSYPAIFILGGIIESLMVCEDWMQRITTNLFDEEEDLATYYDLESRRALRDLGADDTLVDTIIDN